MTVQAPEDRKRYESRLNWLLRQLPDDTNTAVGIHIHWKNGGTSFGWAADLRTNPKIADIDRPGALPKYFQVATITDLGKRFASPRSFIDMLETAVPHFYDNVGRHIRPWQAGPVSGPVEGPEPLTETVASLPDPKKGPQRIVRRGQVGNGCFSVFEDGSIEVETPKGKRRFRDFGELVAFAKSGKGTEKSPLTSGQATHDS